MKKKLTIQVSSLALVLLMVQSLIPRDVSARGNPTTLESQQEASAQLAPAAEMTFKVTNTRDQGPGSLRQSILDANANEGSDTIVFEIPGEGPHTISPASPLPAITEAVFINGVTQIDASGNLLIVLDGSNAGENADGLTIRGANRSRISGLVINRFNGSGIRVDGDTLGAVIDNNYIGTDSTGTVPLGNGKGVEIVRSVGTQVRGNVISGSVTDGVLIQGGSFNRVLGNLIGVPGDESEDPDGVMGNGRDGVRMSGSANKNTIGGEKEEDENVISGNGGKGIRMTERSQLNEVLNNKIGTNHLGTKKNPNRAGGIGIEDSNDNTVGGEAPKEGNLVSGNIGAGISIDPGSMGNRVQGNKIGSDSSGTKKLGNTSEGVRIEGADNNTIGGTTPGAGNIIGGNGDGMSIINASNTTVQGNWIGTNPLGDNLGNLGAGIGLADNSSNNKIGGQTLTAGNWIANNRFGIIAFPGTSGNAFLFNSIFDNTDQSILLASNANRGIRPPQLTSATASNNETIIRGSFSGRPNSQFGIQYSLSSKLNPLEGKIPFGSITLTTNSAGLASADARVPLHVPSGLFITAIATDLATNDTSGFGSGAQVTGADKPDLKVEKSGPESAGCRETITYTITVTNVGTAAAFSPTIIDTLPDCVGDEVEVTTSQQQATSFAQVGNKVITFAQRLAPGDSVTITVKATLTEKCAETITNSVTVDAEGDTNSSNDSDDASTKVEQCPKITSMTTSGKNVVVSGLRFQMGDKIEINGMLLNTKFRGDNELLAKKGKKTLLGCDQANPGRTNVIRLIRPGAFQPIQDTSAFATCP